MSMMAFTQKDTFILHLARCTKNIIIVILGGQIKQPVKVFRRTSYMFWATLDGQPVVLKLVWTPTYCYPEGAGYKVIEDDCAGLIPRVHRSGVLIPDSFGYRLEFLVIENCGITIDEYAADCRKQGMEREVFSATLVQAIRSVATCLKNAYFAGVIHRDVSAGNIAIKDGKARLIDWGYSRLRNDMEILNLASIEEEFAFNNTPGSIEGRRHDSLTGTPFFMSIQVLLETKARGLIHDLESLFYVGLYAYATFSGTIDRKTEKYPLGFQPNSNQAAAAIRVGCLSSKKRHRELFGATDCPEDLASLLDGMYRLLFIQDDEFIGGTLLIEPDYERYFDLDKVVELLFDGPIVPANPLGGSNADQADSGGTRATGSGGPSQAVLSGIRPVHSGGPSLADSTSSHATNLGGPSQDDSDRPTLADLSGPRPSDPSGFRATDSGVPSLAVARGPSQVDLSRLSLSASNEPTVKPIVQRTVQTRASKRALDHGRDPDNKAADTTAAEVEGRLVVKRPRRTKAPPARDPGSASASNSRITRPSRQLEQEQTRGQAQTRGRGRGRRRVDSPADTTSS